VAALLNRQGGYQLLDLYSNSIIAGVRFDLSPDDVIQRCEQRAKTT
jgi:hypothetical protein